MWNYNLGLFQIDSGGRIGMVARAIISLQDTKTSAYHSISLIVNKMRFVINKNEDNDEEKVGERFCC